MAAIVAYNETKRYSDDPDGFGKGKPEGVAASECANNADSGGAPALSLATKVHVDPFHGSSSSDRRGQYIGSPDKAVRRAA